MLPEVAARGDWEQALPARYPRRGSGRCGPCRRLADGAERRGGPGGLIHA